MPKGVYELIPRRQQLRHWERVCVYLDAQPYRSVRHPLIQGADAPPITARLLQRMATHGLVRHTSDCRWELARRWRAVLLRLWEGAPAEDADVEGLLDDSDVDGPPFVADRGVDTLYVSLFAEDIPSALVAACDALKAAAQGDDDTVEAPWVVLGAPLSMYKSGVGTSVKGRGVSGSYILRNAQVMLLVRRVPLSGLIGSVRLSAEALWMHGVRGALDGLRDGLALLWEECEPGSFARVRWQLSQIHLCVDVARLVPAPEDVDRLLMRSLKRALHTPSLGDMDVAWATDEPGRGGDDLADLDVALLAEEGWGSPGVAVTPEEWVGVPLDWLDDGGDGDDAVERQVPGDEDESPADEMGMSMHGWGRRVSGFSFSPGGDLSAVWYDKLLEERLSGKRWMEPIHHAGGWRAGMPLTRIEARFRRGALRDLMALGGGVRWFDDPWIALDHLDDLWGYFAGLPPEADKAPDATWRGWMRLVTPETSDTNRSRWGTDPIWRVVQRAEFGDALPVPLQRIPAVRHDLNQVDAELYGLIKLRAALRGEYLDETATLGLEVRDFVQRMEEVDTEKGRDFAEEVREKARRMGKVVPMRSIGPSPTI